MEQKIGMDLGTKFLDVTEGEKTGDTKEIICKQTGKKSYEIKVNMGENRPTYSYGLPVRDS